MISIDNIIEKDPNVIHNNEGLQSLFGSFLCAFLSQHNITSLPFDENNNYIEYLNKNGSYDKIYLINNEYKVQRFPEDSNLNESTLIIKLPDYVNLADWIRRDRQN